MAPLENEGSLRRVRGAVLAEFAILSIVLWLLLAGILEIGRALTVQQLLQHNARTLARAMARLPVGPELTFQAAVGSPAFQDTVLDTRFLVIDSALLARCGYADFGQPGHEAGLDALFDRLPFGNQHLRPLMIADRRGDQRMLRYPGTLLIRATPPSPACEEGSAFAVMIPRIERATNSYRWLNVIEESTNPNGATGSPGQFQLSRGGWAGVRLNYPFQSVGLMAYRPTGLIDPVTGREQLRLVDDTGPAPSAVPTVGTISQSDRGTGAYAGRAGLGRFYAGTRANGQPRAVRPFRRVLSASAGFRREFFLAGGGS